MRRCARCGVPWPRGSALAFDMLAVRACAVRLRTLRGPEAPTRPMASLDVRAHLREPVALP